MAMGEWLTQWANDEQSGVMDWDVGGVDSRRGSKKASTNKDGVVMRKSAVSKDKQFYNGIVILPKA